MYYNNTFHTVADPLRHFTDSLSTLVNPIGTFFDKLLVAVTRIKVLVKSDEEIFKCEEVSTIDLLRVIGFSTFMIDRFFRPFFGGIFFDRELGTTSRLFEFVFKCLALGTNTLPANGISAIPEQLAGKLPAGSVLLNSRVRSINVGMGMDSIMSVELESGEVLRGESGVILAVEEPEAIRLLGKKMDGELREPRKTVCLYFSAGMEEIPFKDPVLYINGSGEGIVNNMFFVTNVAPSYGPPGKGLVSVSLIGLFEDVSDEDLIAEVVKELSDWFGGSMVGSWRHLRTYRIGFAQPNQCPPTDLMKDPRLGPGLYLCGDYLTSATFDGALVSGRRAVEALLKDEAFVKDEVLIQV